jgi:uncharacterized protein YjbJ (UPF0337 family)
MNKDQVKGSIKDGAGKVQEKFGEALDSPEHEVKGEARQVEGKTQKKVGDVKEGVKNITRKP